MQVHAVQMEDQRIKQMCMWRTRHCRTLTSFIAVNQKECGTISPRGDSLEKVGGGLVKFGKK